MFYETTHKHLQHSSWKALTHALTEASGILESTSKVKLYMQHNTGTFPINIWALPQVGKFCTSTKSHTFQEDSKNN